MAGVENVLGRAVHDHLLVAFGGDSFGRGDEERTDIAKIRAHGGFGFAQEYHVERYFRESVLNFIAPVSEELILSHVAEKALGMPKSY